MNDGTPHKLAEVYGTARDIPETYVVRDGIDDRFLNDITRREAHCNTRQFKAREKHAFAQVPPGRR